jgi:tetratricopeptide (TPR) repeat protein
MNWSKWIVSIFLIIPASWTRVSRLNSAIEAAENSYAEARYEESINNHLVLLEEFEIRSAYLDFDLGLSHHYAQKTDEAAGYYDRATQSTDQLLSSFSFNQGGVILGDKKEYQAALSKFQTALIKNPLNEEARYNYELLARWLKRDEERKQQQNKPEPSDFAKRKKAEADRLVEQFRFADALKVMEDALAQDETVAAYQDFITLLKDVVQINEK